MHPPTFATRANLELLDEYYQRWLADPSSVDAHWQAFFEGFALASDGEAKESEAQTRVVRLIAAHRDLGHVMADLDPLHPPPPADEQLEPAFFNLTPADLDRTFDGSAFIGMHRATLREIIHACRETYCRTIGFEFQHVPDLRIRAWLKDRIEPNRGRPNFAAEQKVRILRSLLYGELFEDFLQSRYQGQKRFSLEGAEALIPLLDTIVQKSASMDIREFVIGMAHRGRLNVLANILGKPYDRIFAEFEDHFVDDSTDGDGDVKYHLGFSNTLNVNGHRVHLSLTPNPSHLESVNAVVEGRVRAKQELFGDTERRMGVPLLIHGDAAMPGQGQVAEALNMAGLEGYNTGGTLHVVINNQIGFTTQPSDSRSTRYCTDVAKLIYAPIFHVNADDAEAVAFVAELALEYRQTFNRDVVIDLVCYRKYGHNEGDEPTYTNPLMYQRVKQKPAPSTIYARKLVDDGVISAEQSAQMYQEFSDKLDAAQKDMRQSPKRKRGMSKFESPRWQEFTFNYSHDPIDTGVPFENLKTIAEGYTNLPAGFHMHEKLRTSVIEKWQESVLKRESVEWGLAESLAFGSLLLDGTPVRLSGQDCRRGTFSQRHSTYVDVDNGQRYIPLNHLRPEQAKLQVWDSPLSEYSVLGFEYGYSLDDPKTLTLWEAQFGDFGNGAQVIIDQYLAAGETKWQRASGLVLLLPHGYEGQGPEHSSARLERFLQLCADDNMQVCNCTTPAQYFHLLRRQMKRNFRKPLVVMTPKSLLRHPMARSPVADLTAGRFHEVLEAPGVDPAAVRRVFLCSGKVYYDFAWDVKEKKPKVLPKDVALIRVEQLHPFPADQIRAALKRFPKVHRFVWIQEEPENMGAWHYMEPRMRALGFPVEYVGRDASSSPATGSYRIHDREQKELVECALADLIPYRVRAVPPVAEKSPETTPRPAK
ncbi:MAG: 2-oxoglutarate dehydrogenase E1 component [Gemmataceae bacterium]|nr:2-oxoglutarate dehydrogenase E1 component [Gemmataceae bacterium]